MHGQNHIKDLWMVIVTFTFVQHTCKHFTPCALSVRPVVLHAMLPLLSLILARENEAFMCSFFVLVNRTRI